MEPAADGAVPAWTLGDRLRKAREHAALKQSELADEIGISRASVVNYESGRYQPSRPVLLSWALSCRVSLNWLAGDCLRPRGTRAKVPALQGFIKPHYSTLWAVSAVAA